MARTGIAIATTEGPALIQYLGEEDADRSSLSFNDTISNRLSGDYNSLLQLLIRPNLLKNQKETSYNLDISKDIGAGDSWKLGVFMAHALLAHPAGQLYPLARNSEDAADPYGLNRSDPPDQIIWVTGNVQRMDKGPMAAKIGGIPDKIKESLGFLKACQDRNIPVTFVYPAQNEDDLSDEEKAQLRDLNVKLYAVRNVMTALEAFDLFSYTAWWKRPFYYGLGAAGMALLIVASLAAYNAGWISQEEQPVPQNPVPQNPVPQNPVPQNTASTDAPEPEKLEPEKPEPKIPEPDPSSAENISSPIETVPPLPEAETVQEIPVSPAPAPDSVEIENVEILAILPEPVPEEKSVTENEQPPPALLQTDPLLQTSLAATVTLNLSYGRNRTDCFRTNSAFTLETLAITASEPARFHLEPELCAAVLEIENTSQDAGNIFDLTIDQDNRQMFEARSDQPLRLGPGQKGRYPLTLPKRLPEEEILELTLQNSASDQPPFTILLELAPPTKSIW